MIHWLSPDHARHVASSYMPPYVRRRRNGANSLSIVGVAQIWTSFPTRTAKDLPHGENSHAVTLELCVAYDRRPNARSDTLLVIHNPPALSDAGILYQTTKPFRMLAKHGSSA